MAKCQHLRGSSYIPLPDQLRSKHAAIYVQNTDKKCFLWSVLTALFPVKSNPHRVTKYMKHQDTLDMTGMSYPVRIPDISKFERLNQISINVFGYEKGDVTPIRITTERLDRHVNLLVLSDGIRSHYCWVKDLNRLPFDLLLLLLSLRIHEGIFAHGPHPIWSDSWPSED